MTSTKTYYFTSVLRTVFTEKKAAGAGDQPAFNDIATIDDFWTVGGTARELVLSSRRISDGARSRARRSVRSNVVQWRASDQGTVRLRSLREQDSRSASCATSSSKSIEFAAHENPRVRRQVTNNSCTVHKKFQSSIPSCYGAYSSGKEDKSTFGPQTNLSTINA